MLITGSCGADDGVSGQAARPAQLELVVWLGAAVAHRRLGPRSSTERDAGMLRVPLARVCPGYWAASKASSLVWASAWAAWVPATVPPKEVKASSVRLP